MESADQPAAPLQKIKLDVGGYKYTTTLATLLSEPQSMFGAMFSGRHHLGSDTDGYHFIDRNGKYFEIILDWLRTKTLPSSLDAESIDILKREADFYQLARLQQELKKWKKKQTQICKRFKSQNQDPVEQLNRLLVHGYTVAQLAVNEGSLVCVLNKPDDEIA